MTIKMINMLNDENTATEKHMKSFDQEHCPKGKAIPGYIYGAQHEEEMRFRKSYLKAWWAEYFKATESTK